MKANLTLFEKLNQTVIFNSDGRFVFGDIGDGHFRFIDNSNSDSVSIDKPQSAFDKSKPNMTERSVDEYKGGVSGIERDGNIDMRKDTKVRTAVQKSPTKIPAGVVKYFRQAYDKVKGANPEFADALSAHMQKLYKTGYITDGGIGLYNALKNAMKNPKYASVPGVRTLAGLTSKLVAWCEGK